MIRIILLRENCQFPFNILTKLTNELKCTILAMFIQPWGALGARAPPGRIKKLGPNLQGESCKCIPTKKVNFFSEEKCTPEKILATPVFITVNDYISV